MQEMSREAQVMDASHIGPDSGGYGCARCQQVFGTLTGFDDHQVRNFGAKVPITCKTPEEDMGYVADARGIWRTPEGLAQRDRNAARLARYSARRAAESDGPVRIDDSAHAQERSQARVTGTPEHPVDIGLGAAIESVTDPMGDARRLLGL